MAEAGDHGTRPRPLSPHIQVYALPINMVMSIVHRITGGALYFGTLILAWWLVAAASGPAYFNYVTGLLASPLGMLVLVGYTWALAHHMLGGVRHLIWDTGRGFDLATVNRLCWASLAGSLALTAAIWAIGLRLKGVL
jgi:succinate dehydrogenase / fumarate reductase cytochrome b subunit